jgi:S-adenosylmethionine:tRNA ribosyltransferase-isomerase
MVGSRSTGRVSHHRFTELPSLLRAGDLLVVNTSETVPAAVPVVDSGLLAHFSTELSAGRWLVELRRTAGKATAPYPDGVPGERYPLAGGATLTLRDRYRGGRLWLATVDTPVEALFRYGQPIRYSYVDRPWPLSAYQTVFSSAPGSAEMPSAGRPFTDRLVTRLVTSGVLLAPLVLHTGVASLEAGEPPYPERFAVPETTARVVNHVHEHGGRVIAIGTTVVRALESAAGTDGTVRAGEGWTDLVVTPERGVRAVDGLLTGFHEPRASHVDMLAAVAGTELLARCYCEAVDAGYLWHEFGDLNLLV